MRASQAIRPMSSRVTSPQGWESSKVVGLLGKGSLGVDDKGSTRSRRLRAEGSAEQMAGQLVEKLVTADLSPEGREVLLATAMIWLPHGGVELQELWQNRVPGELVGFAARASVLLARRRSREIEPCELYRASSALFRSSEHESRDPLSTSVMLHALLLALRELRLDLDDLEPDLQIQVEKALSYLRLHLMSGDYRKGHHFCASPELLLCQVSEMWREAVPLASELRPSLEQAIRWEIQVEAAETPLARAALTIAAENLHLKGFNPSDQRMLLVDGQHRDAQASKCLSRPPVFRRPDGTIFPAGKLMARVFVIRALLGQPRSSSRSYGI